MSNGVTIDITANVARFSSTLDRVTQDLNRFQTNSQRIGQNLSSVFSGLGVGLSVGGFAAIIKSSIDTADNLRDLSKTTGIAVEQLAGLDLASKQSGTSLEDVAGAINKLSVNIGKNGEKFRQLGIDAKDPLQAFQQLADVFNQVEDPQQRAALAAAALGKQWQTVAPLLSEGGKAIGEMVRQGTEMSGVTSEMAENADRFNDNLEEMKKKLAGVGTSIGGAVLEGFNQLIDKISEASGELVTFNSVLTGIGNFAFNSDGIRGLSVEIDNINNRIVAQKNKIGTIKNNGFVGGLIDDIAGIDINLEKNRLDDLLREREKLLVDFQSRKQEIDINVVGKQSQDSINKFISSSGKGSKKGKKKSGSKSQKLSESDRYLQNLQSQLALTGKLGEAEKVLYEIQSGSLGKISEARKRDLLSVAEQVDTYKELDEILKEGNDLAEKQRDDIKSTADASKKLKLELADLSLPASNEFEERLYKVDDALKAGIISAKEAKIELDKLGKLQNAGEFDDVKEKVSKLSEFAVQASHNLQTSLASEIRSGFADGLDGALESFTNFLADAAAEYAASGILELVAGKDGKSGLLGAAVSGLGSLFGGFFASGGPISSGKAYVVGEKGPELFVPNTSGTIVPNNRLGSSSVSGGGTMDVSISTMVNVTGGNGNTDNMAALGGLINSRIRETIVTEKRPGGLLATA